jgi:hypothetical protein
MQNLCLGTQPAQLTIARTVLVGVTHSGMPSDEDHSTVNEYEIRLAFLARSFRYAVGYYVGMFTIGIWLGSSDSLWRDGHRNGPSSNTRASALRGTGRSRPPR